jgi:hypothetical protein
MMAPLAARHGDARRNNIKKQIIIKNVNLMQQALFVTLFYPVPLPSKWKSI